MKCNLHPINTKSFQRNPESLKKKILVRQNNLMRVGKKEDNSFEDWRNGEKSHLVV